MMKSAPRPTRPKIQNRPDQPDSGLVWSGVLEWVGFAFGLAGLEVWSGLEYSLVWFGSLVWSVWSGLGARSISFRVFTLFSLLIDKNGLVYSGCLDEGLVWCFRSRPVCQTKTDQTRLHSSSDPT